MHELRASAFLYPYQADMYLGLPIIIKLQNATFWSLWAIINDKQPCLKLTMHTKCDNKTSI